MQAKSKFSENRLLSGLSAKDLASLKPALEQVEMRPGQPLSQAGRPIRYAYFPISGMISLVQTYTDGATTEVGLIGREGFWGTPLILGVSSAPVEAMVQGKGQALRIEARALLGAIDAAPKLLTRLLRYTQLLHAQVGVTAACNGRHKIPERLARWLLEAHDRLGGDEVQLSHQFLAYMLGIRRAGVTTVLSKLRRRGLIETGRGTVSIRDRKAVEAEACECYRLMKSEARKLSTE